MAVGLLLCVGARAAHADTVHLEQLNIDVEVEADQDAKSESTAKNDSLDSDLFVLRFGNLGETCPAIPTGAGTPTTNCPADFTCVADAKGNIAGTTQVPGYGCLFATAALVDPTAGPAMLALVTDVRAKVAAAHIAHVTTTIAGAPVTFAIRDPREWQLTVLPADDKDAPGALLLAYVGAPPRTGVALLPRPAGALCAPSAPGPPFPWPAQRESESHFGVTKGCIPGDDLRWNFIILDGPDDDDTARRWAIPALMAYLDGLAKVTFPSAPASGSGAGSDERPFWGMGKLWAAGARISPEIADAGAFGAGRIGVDLVVPVTDGKVAPAVAFGTSLGADGSFRIAADIYAGAGLGTQLGGLRLFATAIVGADRDGPDSSFTFGGRGYLGATADAHIPLGFGAIDVDAMWNTVEKRLAAGVSPHGIPLGGGLMINRYDQSSAVMVFVAITEEGLK
jgi:hypothetical protein